MKRRPTAVPDITFSNMGMYDKWRELNIEGVYRQVQLHRRGN